MICCSVWYQMPKKRIYIYIDLPCPSNIFQLPLEVQNMHSCMNQRILQLQPTLGTLWGCISRALHNQPTSPPTIRIIGHVALNQRLIKVRNHLDRCRLWLKLLVKTKETNLAGWHSYWKWRCSAKLVYQSVYDNTYKFVDQSCLTMLRLLIFNKCTIFEKNISFGYIAGFCPWIASRQWSPHHERAKKTPFHQCWNGWMLVFVELHNALPETMQPGPNGLHKKTQILVDTSCIRPPKCFAYSNDAPVSNTGERCGLQTEFRYVCQIGMMIKMHANSCKHENPWSLQNICISHMWQHEFIDPSSHPSWNGHSLSIENVPRNFFGRWSLSIPWRPKAGVSNWLFVMIQLRR